ncbi:UDP-N-acetylglucosamine 2-epimerase (non-hydrolyzing) [Lutimonas halocynthiae]|uniref:non-hydrolyzing UDP-N-acetylglucosamine 2-epimerase n=1 Tax=Lutimonas halocynthiae TaxID=1446477 RepID=UPI0025B5984E|nr:UDP-N-acetylglucosamine 2-epimerase (non-hydrolyzing) [Lutimonas halocynthiae]MDN3642360.1 UDP-N-acetylglucosamine 2-epimerase (non-hydrolyzing) [Lutimonas halocynthiae]
MKKIVSILGARPQFVKAAVLSRIIADKEEFSEVIIHTGQHFDANMSEVFFTEMEIPKPKYNFDINGVGHGAMTGRMLEKIEEVLLIEKPLLVVVYGDTNSTLAGALAAKKLGIRVAHIEAGLRSFNMAMPEEVNRILTDRISDLMLCPTKTAVSNLKAEGFDNFNSKIELSGDIMHDAVEFYGKLSETRSAIVEKLGLDEKRFVMATIHRQENTDDRQRLKAIIEGLNNISDVAQVVMPLHPRTKGLLKKYALNFTGLLIDPVGYFDMLQLLKHCNLVVTDSGGLQKEAYFNEKPCLIVREETEWVELVTEGYASIVGSDAEKMLQESKRYLAENVDFKSGLYGSDVGLSIYESIKKLM